MRSPSVNATPTTKRQLQPRLPLGTNPSNPLNPHSFNAEELMRLPSDDLANELALLGNTNSTARLKAGKMRYSRMAHERGAPSGD